MTKARRTLRLYLVWVRPPNRPRPMSDKKGHMARFLGLDSSTQSLSAVVIDTASGDVVANHSVAFGERLPAYGSPHGFLPNADSRVVHSDPLMWVEALEL